MCVPFTGTEAWTRSLGYKIVDEWRPWLIEDQVVGFTQGYANHLRFLTVKGSGHTVPEYKPAEALNVCWNWDNNKDILEWKNDYENGIQERGKNGNEAGNNNGNEEGGNNDDTTNSIESNSSSSESHEDESPNMVEGRVRRAPSYLEDYETSEGLSDEDNLNAMMIITEDDPLSFEEARKSNK
ncbi:hypothetical protein KIW84_034767 [Lathyrus oleraceus]|uniref:Serine carboxypeptidase n=1 Tax=Pisum sativum TaxID=3888 RepID=A0A9D4Y089_PEA|nr:hypothetical protein KIW84_034767 [Pisum sativum]